jgi:hypothetical protein
MHIWSSVTKETGVLGGNLICGVLESQTGSPEMPFPAS